MLPLLVGRVSIHQTPCDSTQQHPRTVHKPCGGTFLSYGHKDMGGIAGGQTENTRYDGGIAMRMVFYGMREYVYFDAP